MRVLVESVALIHWRLPELPVASIRGWWSLLRLLHENIVFNGLEKVPVINWPLEVLIGHVVVLTKDAVLSVMVGKEVWLWVVQLDELIFRELLVGVHAKDHEGCL